MSVRVQGKQKEGVQGAWKRRRKGWCRGFEVEVEGKEILARDYEIGKMR